jgi:hypothetical protein
MVLGESPSLRFHFVGQRLTTVEVLVGGSDAPLPTDRVEKLVTLLDEKYGSRTKGPTTDRYDSGTYSSTRTAYIWADRPHLFVVLALEEKDVPRREVGLLFAHVLR